MEASTRRPPCFGDDDGLASIVEFEAPGNSGYSGHYHAHPFLSRTVVPRRRGSIRALATLSCSSPRSGRVYDSRYEDGFHGNSYGFSNPPHFLEACFLCKKPLGLNRDIFMYRGDTPFCSEECRQDQIDEDEAKEKKRNLSASVKAMRSKKSKDSTTTSEESVKGRGDYSYRAGTVAAA